jgi:hypothetical protein
MATTNLYHTNRSLDSLLPSGQVGLSSLCMVLLLVLGRPV